MKTLVILKYGFAILGAALLAAGVLWAQMVRSFVADAARAQGTVVELAASHSSGSTTWRPVVRFFSADGREVHFTSSRSSNPPGYKRGEKVEVLYAIADPNDAKINSILDLWLGPLILGGVGAGFLGIGGGMLLFDRSRAQLAARLRSQGTPVQAKFQGVELNDGISVNGAHPWRVVAQWQNPATGEIHVFRSENLWFDPTEHIKRESLTVYVDQQDPRKYVVDVSFLPKLAS